MACYGNSDLAIWRCSGWCLRGRFGKLPEHPARLRVPNLAPPLVSHASTGARDRLACTAVYQRCPETDAERDRTLRSVHDSFEQVFRGFDAGRYPIWRDWLAGAAAHPSRAGVIERMRQAGVLDLPGARDGW